MLPSGGSGAREMARATALVVLIVAASISPARALPGEIDVRSNFFDPVEFHVAPGGTVTWRATDGGHTVTADLGAFDSGGTLAQGQTMTVVAPNQDAYIYYHCAIHGTAGDGTHRGAGMWGVLVVGDPPPPPGPDPDVEIRAVPSVAYPTIASALPRPGPGGDPPARVQIDIAPGIYTEPTLVVEYPSPGPTTMVTFAGTGASPDEVILDGGGTVGDGIVAFTDGVTVQNLTLRNYTDAAVSWQAADRFGAAGVHIVDPGRYGLRAAASRFGRIAAAEIAGASRAGISIQDCDPCDTRIDAVIVGDSGTGIAASNAGALVVRGSLIEHNGEGIALATDASATASPQRGSHIFGNTIVDNTAYAGGGSALDSPSGIGIRISGGSYNVVQANVVRGHLYDIAVTGPVPANVNVIAGNVVSSSTAADLAFDGLGAGTCFAGNTTPEGGDPSTEPPALQTTAACGGSVSVVDPLVDATILAYRLGAA